MQQTNQKISNSEYEALISKTLNSNTIKEKTIVNGKVVSIENDMVIIDVGLKSEGRIPISEFSRPDRLKTISNFTGSAGFAIVLKKENYINKKIF